MGDSSMRRRELLLLLLGGMLFVIAALYRLTELPPAWWDEGWTMSVARNWVVEGHYGHMLLGQPVSPALAGHFPVVAMLAGSFALFGVGFLQARVTFVFCALLSLLVLYLFTRDLYGRRAAGLAILLLCLIPVQWDLTPALVGRQVLGEVPSVLFLTLGFLFLVRSAGNRRGCLVWAALAFGVAIATKAQVVPFVVAGSLVTAVAYYRRDRRGALTHVFVLAGAFAVQAGLNMLRSALIDSHGVPQESVSGLTQVTAMVTDSGIRISTIRFALLSGLPVTIGLLWTLVRQWRLMRNGPPSGWSDSVELLALLIAVSWFAWYVFLSIGWGRYAFPPVFLAAPFMAHLILSLADSVFTVAARTRAGQLKRFGAATLLLVFAVVLGRQVVLGVREVPSMIADTPLEAVADSIEANVPEGCTIETYESELLFLLDRPCHFPPPQLNVDLIRKGWLDSAWKMPYDLRTVKTDYLLVGSFGGGLYEPLIRDSLYVPAGHFGAYRLYRRPGQEKVNLSGEVGMFEQP
jgi:hypothetical protein